MTSKNEENMDLKEIGYKDGRWMVLVSTGLEGIEENHEKTQRGHWWSDLDSDLVPFVYIDEILTTTSQIRYSGIKFTVIV